LAQDRGRCLNLVLHRHEFIRGVEMMWLVLLVAEMVPLYIVDPRLKRLSGGRYITETMECEAKFCYGTLDER